jgi:hypothetical protein
MWRIQIERHFAIITANALAAAVRIASRAKIVPPIDPELVKDITLLRHPQRALGHPDPAVLEQGQPSVERKSARQFAERHPGTSPHEFLGWNS